MKDSFKQHISELNNVTWPTRKQAVHSMIVVLVFMFLSGFFLGALDNILNQGFSYFL